MDVVAILMDAVKKKADVRTTTNWKKRWTLKPWRGGMQIVGVMRKEKVNWRIIKMIQKSELQQVPVEQRVPGRVYGVADRLEGELQTMAFHKDGYYDTADASWNLWFAIPESMFPVRELPDQIKLDLNDWSYSYSDSVILLHRKKIRPESMLPVQELPDEFELKRGEWDVKTTDGNFSPLYCDFEFRRVETILNPFCIHAGTKSEQIAELEKILAEFKQS
jgi:hypothetical protein